MSFFKKLLFTQLSLTRGLIGWWKFDEGTGSVASDSAGANPGTLIDATWTTGKIGPFAITCDLITSYISTPLGVVVDTEWTLSAWTLFPLIAAGSGYLTLFRGANDHFILVRTSVWELGIYLNTQGGPGLLSSGFDVSTLNGWHLVTAVTKGGQTFFYIDAVLVGNPINAKCLDNILYIGNYPSQGGAQQWGTFDDVRVYNRALNNSEIMALYLYKG